MKELTKDERAAAMAAIEAILDDCPRFTRTITPTEMDKTLRTIVDLRDGWVEVGRREAHAKPSDGDWVIEFRNGAFFQNLEADHGGPLVTAQRFASKDDVSDFFRKHGWLLLNGAMAMCSPPTGAAQDVAKAHMHEAKRLIREAWQAWDSDRDSKCGKRIGDASRAVDAAIRALEATA